MTETNFPLTENLRGKNIQQITYDSGTQKVLVFVNRKATAIDVDLENISKTAQNCELVLNGQLDNATKHEIILIISAGLAPYAYDFVKNGNGNGEANKNKDKKEKEPTKKKIAIKKYTRKGTIPLHECVVIGEVSKFVYLDKNQEPRFVDEYERANDTLVPADTFDTQTPIPFIFESEKEFQVYLEEAKKENLDSIFLKFESINRKYVDIEDHYHVLLVADMIWTWLQDRFGYTHYIIITGDNGSGKNSQLLVLKYLGYRVFYVVSASAANYYTIMGIVEEGQVTIAEDEAGDIADDKDKRNVFKTGYASGGSIPKVETDGGRKQDNWLTYCQKWAVMEEQSTHREMKGILDRSLVLRFVAGDPQYNIKDVINSAGDPKYKPLYDELMGIRKLMFCWRLLHHEDIIPDVKINVKNRSAELTKPLIRLFQNSPIALERILDSLSKFMVERNEVRQSSFESKLYQVINELKTERELELKKDTLDDIKALGPSTFMNSDIYNYCKKFMEGEDVIDKPGCFYSHLEGIGLISQKRITSICKSKFKAKPDSVKLHDSDGSPKTFRCLKFEEKYLERIESSYKIPSEIKISEEGNNNEV